MKKRSNKILRSPFTANNQSDIGIDGVNFILSLAHVGAVVDAARIRHNKFSCCCSTAGELRQRRLVSVRHGHGWHGITVSAANEINDVAFPRHNDVAGRLVVTIHRRRKFANFRSN